MVRALLLVALAACGRVGFDQQVVGDAVPSDGAQGADAAPPPGRIVLGGRTACFLTDGDVWCWGNGEGGRLGDGNTTTSPVPVQAVFAEPASTLFAGDGGLCTQTQGAGAAYCWGPNRFGLLGLGDDTERSTPQSSTSLDGAIAIAFATNTACAIRLDSSIECAGERALLGNDASPASRPTFAPIADPQDFTAIAAGDDHFCALTPAGSARCWGVNTYGALGNGTTAAVNVSSPVDGPAGPYDQLVAGDDFTCARTPSSTVDCWGDNSELQLGTTGPARGTAMAVEGLTDVRSLVAGSYGACALRSDSTVWCWGDGAFGGLGDGTETDRATPGPAAIDNVAMLASATDASFCALRYDGSVWCWGRNENGQLGIGSVDTSAHLLPERVVGLP